MVVNLKNSGKNKTQGRNTEEQSKIHKTNVEHNNLSSNILVDVPDDDHL